MLEKEDKLNWVSALRVLATMAVIVVHVSMASRYENVLNVDLIYGALARFCVPVFIMLTGVLLIPKETELFLFTKKWVLKIIVPFLFWNIPYLIYNHYKSINALESFNLQTSLFESFKCLYRNGNSFHFWYIYMIIGVYLFIPVIGKWARNASQKELLYFLALWFCLLLLQIPSMAKYNPAIELSYFSGYIGYLILGFYLNRVGLNFKLWVPGSLILIGYFLTSALTYYSSLQSQNFVHTYYDYLRPNVVILSAGMFLFIKKLDQLQILTSFINKFWRLVEKHSYGIYLIHLLVLYQLQNYGIDYNFIHPLVGIPICSILCFLISFSIVWLINRMPYIGAYISG